jgi:hypothetical protein
MVRLYRAENVQVRISKMLTPDAQENLRYVVVERDDVERGALLVQLEHYILALGEEKHVEKIYCPADWWEHFKLRWAPEWFTRRWPVQMAEHVFAVKKYAAACPHHNTADQGQHLEWLAATLPDVEEKL